MKLRVADSTAWFIEAYSSSMPQAQLLSGPVGIGLATVAKHLAETNGALLSILQPEAKTAAAVPAISAERIRNLYIDTRSKLHGAHFVIIDDADAMNHVAQNALLKLLEEPNDSIHFILTTHKPENLLPTIRSRAPTFTLPRISTLESRRLLKSQGVDDELTEQRLLFVADGLPAELNRLLGSESNFILLSERVQKARQIAQGSTYERLITISTLKDDRQSCLKLIETIIMLLRRSLTASPNKSSVELIGKMITASERIKANGNIRLHLSEAVLQ